MGLGATAATLLAAEQAPLGSSTEPQETSHPTPSVLQVPREAPLEVARPGRSARSRLGAIIRAEAASPAKPATDRLPHPAAGEAVAYAAVSVLDATAVALVSAPSGLVAAPAGAGIRAARLGVADVQAIIVTTGHPPCVTTRTANDTATATRSGAVVLALLGGGPLVPSVGDIDGTTAAVGSRPRVAQLVAVVAAVSTARPRRPVRSVASRRLRAKAAPGTGA